MWIGTASNGLFYYKNNNLKKFKGLLGFKNSTLSLLYCDNSGKIWVGTANGDLYCLEDEEVRTFSLPKAANGVFAALCDNEGVYYFGTRNGIYTFKGDSLVLLNNDINFINDIKEDNNGKIWFATNTGLYNYDKKSNSFVNFSKLAILDKQIIQSVFFDDDNVVWVSTYRKGLIQIRTSAFYNFPFKYSGIDGIPSSILMRDNGTIWVGTDEENIYEIKDGIYKRIKIKTDLKGGRIKNIYQDKEGDTWICSYAGLLHIKNGKETLIGGSEDFTDKTIRYILQDKDGNFWVATRQSGIYKITPEYKVVERHNINNGLSANYILAMRLYGDDLYVATKRGINILRNGKIIKHYNQSYGLSDDMVFDVYLDSSKVLWAATIKGLSRIENGRVINFTTSNGLKYNKIFSIVEDNFGYFWLPGIKGLMRIEKKQLNNFVNDSTIKIKCALYNKSDGIYDDQYVGATHMVKSSDGKIIFNTMSGISIVDPNILHLQKSRPKLLINSIVTENTTSYNPNKIELPAETKYIQISYSYIDFINPDKATFRYKLFPFEQEWVKNNNIRKIPYTNLPPGEYEFIVEAAPELGKGKPIIASFKFSILPKFYETLLFKIVGGGLLVYLVYFMYRLRTRTLKKNQIKLENEIKKRTNEITKQKEEISQKTEDLIISQSQIEMAYLNLELLSDQGREITSYLTHKGICSNVYKHVSNAMDSAIFGLGIYNSDTNKIEFKSSIHKGSIIPDFSIPITKENCLLSQSFVNDEEIVIDDTYKELKRGVQTFPKTSSIQMVTSLIILPIKLKEKVIGIITAQSYRRNSYSDYQSNILHNLVVYIGVAIENSKNYKKIDEQKNELQEVNAAKDRMFSLIGHDLRGPVGTIKSFLDIILENPEKAETIQIFEILKTMQQSLGSAYNLLDNLLLWAQGQQGKTKFRPRLFNICQPIDESIGLVLGNAKSKGLDLIKKTYYTGPVFADQLMVTTVLRNLISNAIKFTPENRKIIVKTDLIVPNGGDINKKLIEVSIIDSGIGVTEEVIDRILRSTETYTTVGTNEEKGFGLGINICIDFLKQHKQKLFVENNTETNGNAEGCTFKFHLPTTQ